MRREWKDGRDERGGERTGRGRGDWGKELGEWRWGRDRMGRG